MDEGRARQVGTTPFPNYLLDEVLPGLKGSEAILLCVLVRQTCGWTVSGGRKHADWLTHQQIRERTGLSSATICRAIDTLVRKGVIRVSDGSGKQLATPAERRRHAGRLYFGLCQQETKNGRNHGPAASQKVKTTKESNNTHTFVDFKNEKAREPLIAKSGKVTEADLSSEAVKVLRLYEAKFRQHQGLQAMPAVMRDDLAGLRTILDKHGTEVTEALLDRFLAGDYRVAARQHYSLEAFRNSVNLLLALRGASKSKHNNRPV